MYKGRRDEVIREICNIACRSSLFIVLLHSSLRVEQILRVNRMDCHKTAMTEVDGGRRNEAKPLEHCAWILT